MISIFRCNDNDQKWLHRRSICDPHLVHIPDRKRTLNQAQQLSDKGFIRSANAIALMSGKGYYLDTTGSMRFGDPAGGYIKFTESEGVTIAGSVSISGTSTIGGTTLTVVKDGAALGNSAQQNNSAKTDGSVGGWTVDSNSIFSGTKDTSGYSTTGITLFSGGSIHAPNFYIDTAGSAFFRGTISAGAGDIGGWTINTDAISKGNISLNSTTQVIQIGSSYPVKLGTLSIYDGLDSSYRNSIYLGENGLQAQGTWTDGADAPENRIRILAGDRVTVEMTPYDLTKARIKLRLK